jgi:hypothetical protein
MLLLMSLIVAGCASDGDSSNTTAPATTTTAGSSTETTAPAETTTTISEADALMASAMERSWRIGITGEGVFNRDGTITGFQFNKLPLALAIMDMNANGWDIAPIFLNQSEAPVQALIQGSLDIANSSITPVITAVAAGAEITVFAKARGVEYVMLTRSDINGPEDFDGKKVGLHAAASTTTLLTKLYLKDATDIEPDFLIVPGSGNRIQAMLAGELDATAAQFGDDTRAMEEAPDDFHVIFNFAKEMQGLIDSAFSYNNATFDDLTRVFAEELLAKVTEYNRLFYEDPNVAKEKSVEFEVAEAAGVERYLDSEIFPVDIGMDADSLAFTIDGLVNAELIESPGPDGASFFDSTIWEAISGRF